MAKGEIVEQVTGTASNRIKFIQLLVSVISWTKRTKNMKTWLNAFSNSSLCYKLVLQPNMGKSREQSILHGKSDETSILGRSSESIETPYPATLRRSLDLYYGVSLIIAVMSCLG